MIATMRDGFNEAGAIMPRSGLRQVDEGSERLGIASMRPGQSCPGVAPRRRAGDRIDLARFNEAGAIMPRSGVASPVVVLTV